jgi:nicotinate-nucleotide adenylyltransferase
LIRSAADWSCRQIRAVRNESGDAVASRGSGRIGYSAGTGGRSHASSLSVPNPEQPLPHTKIGVLGGTFNPIHSGHVHLAVRAQRIFQLSSVHFVAAALPPHKPLEGLLSLEHRYAMLCLATSGRPGFLPSLAELDPPVSPYSIDTLAKIARSAGVEGSSLYFIGGGDSLAEVSGWRESRQLLSTYNFVFAVRPGFQLPTIAQCLPADLLPRVVDLRAKRFLPGKRHGVPAIFIVDVSARRVSSSQVRRLSAAGRDVGRLVPARVREYILKLHPYGER